MSGIRRGVGRIPMSQRIMGIGTLPTYPIVHPLSPLLPTPTHPPPQHNGGPSHNVYGR